MCPFLDREQYIERHEGLVHGDRRGCAGYGKHLQPLQPRRSVSVTIRSAMRDYAVVTRHGHRMLNEVNLFQGWYICRMTVDDRYSSQ